MTTPLDCQRLVDLVTDYLEGVLDTSTRLRFHEHLAGCEGCETYLDQMRATLQLLGSIPPQSLDRTAQDRLLRDRLLQAFRSWSVGGGTEV
jgi:anti-sigma factor RsiW